MPRTGLTLETFGGLGIDVNEPVAYISVLSSSTQGRGNRRITAGQSDNGSAFESSTSAIANLSDRIVSMKVTADSKKVAQAEITFYNEDLALNDTPIIQKGTLVKLSWGYSGYMSKPRTFKVQKVKGTRARVKNMGQLTVICYAQTFDLHGKVRSICYKNTTPTAIARQIARRYGIRDGDLVLGQDNGKRQTVHQVNQTDAQFLQSLAQKLGWTFQVEDGVLTFADVEKIDKNLPIASYTYFTDEVGWIKRFEPQTTVVSTPGAVTVKSRDPISGKKVQHTQTIENRQQKSLCRFVEMVPATKGGAQIVEKKKVVHRNKSPLKSGVTPSNQVVNTPAKNSSQVKQESKTRHQNAIASAVQSRLVIVGDPDIWHGVLLNLENVGKMFTGLHRVHRCIHLLDNRGYEVDCKLRRDGVGTLGKGKKAQPDQKAKSQRVTRRLQSRVVATIRLAPILITGVVKRTKFNRR